SERSLSRKFFFSHAQSGARRRSTRFSLVFSHLNAVFPSNVVAPSQEKQRDAVIFRPADLALSERIAGYLTLLTSQHGREALPAMAETVGSPQAAGQPGHFQALVF